MRRNILREELSEISIEYPILELILDRRVGRGLWHKEGQIDGLHLGVDVSPSLSDDPLQHIIQDFFWSCSWEFYRC